jgi:hypothetical protein
MPDVPREEVGYLMLMDGWMKKWMDEKVGT